LKKFGIIFLFSLSCFILIPSLQIFASDRLGCLTCHRYPGLVILEKSGTFKTLHIDEERHLSSPHGKVDCRQCHDQVNQIPHSGFSEVDCTTNCHLDDKEKVLATKPTFHLFHKEERFVITRLEDKSSCRVCHPLYPHSANHKVRALLNMHTGYLVCEVCHLKIKDFDMVTYNWKSPEVFEFTGEPYGTVKKREIPKAKKTENVISKMLKIFSHEDIEGQTVTTEYLLSRIAAYSVEKSRKNLLLNTEDNEKAKSYLAREKDLSQEKKEEELQYFHRDIARKEISVACNGCHSPDGMLDYVGLGFNKTRTKDLEYMNIKSLVTKYDVFYLPNLFGQ
jgi:hypothetical protein